MEYFETRNIQEPLHTQVMSPLQVCRGYAKHGICPFPDTCIYAHPPPPEMHAILTPPVVPNLASAHAWEAAGQYFEPVGTGNQGPVCQGWIQGGTCPYGPSCQYTHPPLAVQFPGKPPLPSVFPSSPQQMMYPSFLPPHSKVGSNVQMLDPNNLPGHLSPLTLSNNPSGLINPMVHAGYPPVGHYHPQHQQMGGRAMYPHRRPPQLCKNWNKSCKFGENCRYYHPPPGENPPMLLQQNIYMESPPVMDHDTLRPSPSIEPTPQPLSQTQSPQTHPITHSQVQPHAQPQPQPQPQHQAQHQQPQHQQPQHQQLQHQQPQHQQPQHQQPQHQQPQHQQPQHQQPQHQAQPQHLPQSHLQPSPSTQIDTRQSATEKDTKETANPSRLEQKHDVTAPPQPAPTTERSGKKKPRARKNEKKRKEEGGGAPEKANGQPQVPANATPEKKEADPKKEAELDQKIELIRLSNAQSEARHNEVMADKARAKEQEDTERRSTRRDDGSHSHGAHHNRRPGPNANSKKHYTNNADGTTNGHQSQQQPSNNRPYNNNNNYHSNSSRPHPNTRPVKTYVPTQQSRAPPSSSSSPAAAPPSTSAQPPSTAPSVANGR